MSNALKKTRKTCRQQLRPTPKRHIIDAGGVFLGTKTVFDGAFAEQNRTKESM
jgi:hypothetical protein